MGSRSVPALRRRALAAVLRADRADRGEQPGLVVDLGCGPGQLTAELARRWPGAEVLGVDSSAEMIAAASRRRRPGPPAQLRPGRPAGLAARAPVDVIVSNAVLQWVPDHEALLPGWAQALSPGGWLAFQVPANFDEPSHVIMRELAGSGRWRPLLADVALNRQAADPAAYLDLLSGAGCVVNAWETTYLHVLPGPDPVLRVVQGHRPAAGARGAGAGPGRRVPGRVRGPAARGLPAPSATGPCCRSAGCSWSPGRRSLSSSAYGFSRRRAGPRARCAAWGRAADSPFQARFTRCAATSSSLGLRASSHHCR